ncbi:hypothetical protein [Thermovenabulum sp.]|uniref:hypothetical protein n=1 Tax=Thermovenabulum sp. TaxID=3100335 RepID=UPI003C79794E
MLKKKSLIIIFSIISFIIISNTNFSKAQVDEFDIGGYTIVQTDGQNIISSFTIPEGTMISKYSFLIIANNVTKSSFESQYYPIPANAFFINSSGKFPEIFSTGDGKFLTGQFILYDRSGNKLDESIFTSISKIFLRIDPLSQGSTPAAWEVKDYTNKLQLWNSIQKKSSGKIVLSHIVLPYFPNIYKKFSFVALYFDKNNPPSILNISSEGEITKGSPFNIRVSAQDEDSNDFINAALKYKYMDSEDEFTLPLGKDGEDFFISFYPEKSILWRVIISDGKEEVSSGENILIVKENENPQDPDEENNSSETANNENTENNSENVSNTDEGNFGENNPANNDPANQTNDDNSNINNNNIDNNNVNNNIDNNIPGNSSINITYIEKPRNRNKYVMDSFNPTPDEIAYIKKVLDQFSYEVEGKKVLNHYRFFFNHFWDNFFK